MRPSRPVLLAALAMAIGARAVRARVAADTLDDELQAKLTQQAGFAWSASRPLAWADFAAPPPAGGDEGAHTVYSLLYGFRCARGTFESGAIAAFLTRQSWVLPAVVANPALSARTLDHEQTHFNLTETFARRLRKYFAGLYDPCGVPDETIRAAAERIVADEHAAQARYDDDTRHGLDAARQHAWDADVASTLASLAPFGQ